MTAESVAAPETDVAASPTPPQMRRAMGAFATGVTVITGLAVDREPVGFACQSFASVSLEPPLVLFCAGHKGRTWPRIRASGRFCVNVLAEDQTDLCTRFGSGEGRKYEGLDWDLSRWDTPSLRGVLMRAHAEVSEVHVAGDHDVVIGRVLQLETADEERPMLFFRGRLGVHEEPAAGSAPLSWGWGNHWG
ncbi:flavin oxidoreductase [Streptomyces oceani]|uniref:Flavin oxidoreductase n=1 Tax=Streptomyces oceani TaxID=1075402 RepID=A0A1E7KL21_9ACTN|nr:flavin reductase family protein [Streptomyces oceani]OEV04574.1 flavin oxidoreductase [Streptomyces oceani]